VLEMPIEEALEFFAHIPKIRRRVDALAEVGLGYMRLGQPATTLSGGEAQRVKLAAELSKVATGRTMYILDEPTTGLHFADIQRLLDVLQRLVDNGNSVVVIEHNLDVIKVSDRLIDLGPEGGDEGGQVIAQGTPEQVVATEDSYTGHFLAEILPIKAARTRRPAGSGGTRAGKNGSSGTNGQPAPAARSNGKNGRGTKTADGEEGRPKRARRRAAASAR
jgi:excinuclease ABC subunit A